MGLIEVWGIAHLMKKYEITHWILNPEDFKLIDVVMEKRPQFLCFGLMWAPFQSQYNTLLPPLFSQIDFKTYFIFSFLGNYTVQLPFLFSGKKQNSVLLFVR